jgi:hypothetical protein
MDLYIWPMGPEALAEMASPVKRSDARDDRPSRLPVGIASAARCLLLGLISLVVIGCGDFDFKMTVANDSGQTLFIRVPAGVGDRHYVTRVDSGAHGMAVAWKGDRSVVIELLRPDCSLLGTFQSQDGVTFTVPSLVGLTAAISRFDSMRDGRNEPGLVPTDECGGTVFH